MPERQYFYTPVVTENHNIGEQDVNGDYITSTACTPAASDPSAPIGPPLPVSCDGLMCLRVDLDNNRCVISLPQSTNQIYLQENLVDLGILAGGDWQQVNKAQIQSEYSNPETYAPDSERVIDFTVEEGN